MSLRAFLEVTGLALRAYVQNHTERLINEEERLTERITSLSVDAGESELLEIEKLKRKRSRYREYLRALRSNVSYDD